MSNYFNQLNAINVSEHIEKKGAHSYLSWPYAIEQLRKTDATASWEICRFNGLPYLHAESGVFVEVAVTVQGIRLSQIHPVLDGRNKPILAPNVFEINTSIQRCLVKAIALHGLGLYVYAGEDLPAQTVQPAANDPELKNEPLELPGKAGVVSATQLAHIRKLMKTAGASPERILAYFSVEDLAHIPASEYPRVIRSLEKRSAA